MKFCNSKKFSRQFGYKVEDLELKSADIVLGGEELAGSTDTGLVKVTVARVRSTRILIQLIRPKT